MNTEKKQRYLIITLIGILLFLTTTGGIVFAEREGNSSNKQESESQMVKTEASAENHIAGQKEETVYLLTDASGKEQERIVSAEGELQYEGYEDKTLPVTMKIDYTLNGRSIEPEKLAGENGQVEITLHYINHEKQGEIYTPFLAVSGMVLDEGRFSNISVDNGKVISDGTRSVVVGYGFPGLQQSLDNDKVSFPQTVTVTAQVRDFSLETIYTLATAEPFTALNVDGNVNIEDVTKKISQMTDGITQLQQGSEGLSAGAEELAVGAEKLAMGTTELYRGTETLYNGMDNLSAGAASLKTGTNELAEGAAGLKDGSQQLEQALTALSGGLSTLSENSLALRQGTEQIMTALFNTASERLNDMGLSVTLTPDNYGDVLQQIETDMPETAQALQSLNAQLDQAMAFYHSVKTYTEGVDAAAAGSAEITQKTESIVNGAESLSDGAEALRQGQEQLYAGINNLFDGTANLSAGAKSLQENQEELFAGTKSLQKATVALQQGISQMAEEIEVQLNALPVEELQQLMNRLEQLKTAAESYTSFTGISQSQSVKFIFKADSITQRD